MFRYLPMLLAVLACVPKPNQSETKVVNGKELSESEYPSVVRVTIELGGGAMATCTASIISEETMITASHCLVLDSGAPAASAIAWLNGNKKIPGGAVHLHPQYNNSTAGNDVAFVKFPKGTFQGYTPMKLSNTVPKSGDAIKIIGYGKYDHFNDQSGGQKRIGYGTVLGVGTTVDFRGAPRPTDGSGQNAVNSQGDSGGPMVDKNDEIIGISSTVDAVDADDGKRTGHYTSLHHPAIVTLINKFSDNTLPENNNPVQVQTPVPNQPSDPVNPGDNSVTQPGDNKPPAQPPSSINPVDISKGTCICQVAANRYGQGCTVTRAGKVILEAQGPYGCENAAACQSAWQDQLRSICSDFQ